MRLICPNCGATYEVDANLVPATGRDVQCSNCGHGWFQHPEDPDMDLDDALDDEPEIFEGEAREDTRSDEDAEAPRQRRSLDPGVTDVLREEAEREAAARKAEAAGNNLESQPDLGLDETDERAVRQSSAARARMARLRGRDDDDPDADGAGGPRSELLPDVEESNSTLRGQDDREEAVLVPDEAPAPPARRGFRTGFLLVVLLCVIAVAVYALAPQIARAVPQAEPYLAAYVDWVNVLRVRVNALVAAGVAWVQGMISG